MKKYLIILVIFIAVVMSGFIFYRWFSEKDLPYGKLTQTSELCKKPELQNRDICTKSGCIWGNGDLTGPPFCGAYKE